MNPAQKILEQLGGNRFVAMVGAKSMSHSDGGRTLNFHFKRMLARGRTNHCSITLAADDTYTVQFNRYDSNTFEIRPCGEILKGIHVDQLRDAFTNRTGLATSL